jgi:hypothetical protein
MKLRKSLLALVFLTTTSVFALAADFSGKWTAKFDTQIGPMNYTYEFHVDGTTVTGTAANDQGSVDIKDGKIDGDTITFVEVRDFGSNSIKIVYTGKINGEQIEFTRDVGGFATEKLSAQRAK